MVNGNNTLPVIREEKKEQVPTYTEIQQLIIDKYIDGLSEEEILGKHGIGRTTLYRRLKTKEAWDIRFKLVPEAAKRQIVPLWAENTKLALEVQQDYLLSDIKKDPNVVNNIAGTGTDKLNVMTGMPTAIILHADYGKRIDELDEEETELREHRDRLL